MKLFTVLALLAATVPLTAARRTVKEIVENEPDLSILRERLQFVDLLDDLGGAGPFTVLAPTNAAFTAINVGHGQDEGGQTVWKLMLEYHVVPERIHLNRIPQSQLPKKFETLQGISEVTVDKKDGNYFFDDSMKQKKITGSNGIVYFISKVLSPKGDPAASSTPPPSLGAGRTDPEDMTVWEYVVHRMDLVVMEVVLYQEGLRNTLDGPGPVTLFAPNNAAWAKEGINIGPFPRNPHNRNLQIVYPRLEDTLKYHIVRQDLDPLRSGTFPTMANGRDLDITRESNGSFKLNNEGVVQEDQALRNGHVYILDAVVQLQPTHLRKRA